MGFNIEQFKNDGLTYKAGKIRAPAQYKETNLTQFQFTAGPN